MPEVLPWRSSADLQEVVRRAARSLAAGQLVAFPTETVYGLAASALVPEAVEQLRQSKGRPVEKPLALAVGEDVALVIDDGPCHYGQASTVVQVRGDDWDLLREGVFTKADLERQSASVIVFVCTGNTCRSPLAEGLCKKLLAERLGCSLEELPGRGFLVLSAGLSAMMGGRAAAESVEAAREFGVDLTGHRSRPLAAELVAQADHLVVMTQGHALALTA